MDTYTTHIKSKNGWFDVDLAELWHYKDLIILFVKRTYSTRYKQTILGPMWLVLNPLITVLLYSLVFGNIAGLSTDGSPQFAFYLCSNAIWSYFATSLTNTSNTFTANANIMGKVYFPRLVMPISAVITGILDLLIQLGILAVVLVYYAIVGTPISFTAMLLVSPLIIIQVALLGLGCGIIIAACTTKYRDLVILVSFGVQLWMYASPVVYTTAVISENLRGIYMLNPMAPIISCWRYAILGTGEFPMGYWGISWIVTFVILFIGVMLFSHIEKTFMDTV
ncbi:MAG: ABC transporter permease [Bacteroidaceae bacterium]|nr:ABC transporter permease [Bacteroidaceae bacterium]